MNFSRKGLLTAGVVLLVGTLTGLGTFSAFTGTTTNPDNLLTAGTVTLTDNDAAAPMYSVNPYGGVLSSYCITVTYTGTLDALGELYLGANVSPLGQYTLLTVEQGSGVTGAFPSCTGFVAGSTIFTGTLQGFRDTHFDNTNGLTTNPPIDGTWDNGDVVSYRFTVEVTNNLAQGLTTGLHPWTWEATAI